MLPGPTDRQRKFETLSWSYKLKITQNILSFQLHFLGFLFSIGRITFFLSLILHCTPQHIRHKRNKERTNKDNTFNQRER
uniref:Uncharacterized protein n=1 Tax=Rhizophora mucronata TaxID=61149 RepID=A0A2P2PSD8_RHIMU